MHKNLLDQLNIYYMIEKQKDLDFISESWVIISVFLHFLRNKDGPDRIEFINWRSIDFRIIFY